MNRNCKQAEAKEVEGILLVNKTKGKSSFNLVRILRKTLGVKKIGHAGTLDPFATGVMVMLIGRRYTRLSDQFLLSDKEYEAEIRLGISTNTYDCEGEITSESNLKPTLAEIEAAINHFQGEIEQIPPMFSAKKLQGKKLYDLAREGKTVERAPVKIQVQIQLISYHYPFLCISVRCSKGTYIRSLGHDLGQKMGCGAHLSNLKRTRSGHFLLENCIDESALTTTPHLTERFIHACTPAS